MRLIWRLINRRRRSADLIAAGVAAVSEPLLLVDDNKVYAEMEGDRWFAVLVGEGGFSFRVPLDLEGPEAYLLARLESLEFALSAAPPIVVAGDNPDDSAVILGIPEEGHPGKLFAGCPHCGGFELDLVAAPHQPPPIILAAATGMSLNEAMAISSRYRGAYARLCAYRFLHLRDQLPSDETVCLGCITRDVREGNLGFEGPAAIWFDTDSSQWQLWQPLSGDQGVSVPLGIDNFFTDPGELEEAARSQLNF